MSFAESSERYHDQLKEQIDRASEPVYMQTKADLVDYYRDAHGEKGWRRAAATTLSGTSDSKSRAYQSAMRNFQGKRLGEAGATSKWKELGEKLPPIGLKPPKKGYKVTFNGRVKVSEGRRKGKGKGKKGMKGEMRGDGWTNASFSVKITGADALDFAENPNFDIIFSEYFRNFETNPVTDFSISSISVEPIE